MKDLGLKIHIQLPVDIREHLEESFEVPVCCVNIFFATHFTYAATNAKK